MEKGNGLLKERKIYSVIARDSRMKAVTNVFQWNGRYDLAMNICSERKYLCALYYCAQGARGIPFLCKIHSGIENEKRQRPER